MTDAMTGVQAAIFLAVKTVASLQRILLLLSRRTIEFLLGDTQTI